jgi:hypothetical protein
MTAQQQVRWVELPSVRRVESGPSGTRMNTAPGKAAYAVWKGMD